MACVVGYHAVMQAVAEAELRRGAVIRAYTLAPHHPRIAATMARALFEPGAPAADRAKAIRLAHEALRRDPTTIIAATTLGLDVGLRGQDAAARRLLAYSQKLSRRDFPTQVWAIEDAVNRNDIPAALHGYDVALRTSRNAPQLLFPILASAITDPSIRAGLIPTLRRNPSWRHAFVEFVAENGPDPQATAHLFRGLHQAKVAISDQANATVTKALVEKNLPDAAWTFYASLHPGADRRISRDPRFTAIVSTPAPFDWVPLGSQGISTSFQRDDRGGIFDFSAPASVGGPLLTQMQMLPPGNYQLTGHSSGIDQPAASLPYWVLSCAGGRELGRVTVPNSVHAGGTFSGSFTVAADCPVQSLTFVAQPSDAISGVSGQIDQLLLRPAAR